MAAPVFMVHHKDVLAQTDTVSWSITHWLALRTYMHPRNGWSMSIAARAPVDFSFRTRITTETFDQRLSIAHRSRLSSLAPDSTRYPSFRNERRPTASQSRFPPFPHI
ncbi:hypothetical protein DPSP01_006438 [Paraphaeosphaeria sporulosa]